MLNRLEKKTIRWIEARKYICCIASSIHLASGEKNLLQLKPNLPYNIPLCMLED